MDGHWQSQWTEKVFVAIVDSEGIGQQSVPNAARKVKEAKVGNGEGEGKNGKSGKGKTDDGKEKGKGKGDKWQARKTQEGYCSHCWKWGHMEKDCFTKAETKGKGKSAGSLDESEASEPENTSVGGCGLCLFGSSQYDERKWNDCRKVTFTLDTGAAVVTRAEWSCEQLSTGSGCSSKQLSSSKQFRSRLNDSKVTKFRIMVSRE